jgi:hypothetical protein
MVLGSQTITVLDPGLGLTNVAATTPIKMGVSSLGTVGQLYSFSSLNFIRSTLGFGDLADDVAKTLREAGGPVLAMRGTGSVAAVLSAVTRTGTGPLMSAAGVPTMRTQTRVRVKTGGTLGVATFDYSHDYHQPTMVSPTFSQSRVIPAGGTFVFTNVGVTVTFPAGTYVAGDTYDFTCEPAHLNASDLAVLFGQLATVPSVDPRLAHVTDAFSTATEGFAMASALGGQLQTFASGYRYARGFCDVGSGDTSANVLIAKAAFTDKRIVDAYGFELQDAALPFEGWSVRKVSSSSQMAARAASSLISTDLARYASGSLGGSRFIYFDGFQDQTLDAAGIATLRTWPRIPGFYVANGALASPIGSDYTRLQFGRVMDEACSAVYEAMLPFVNEGLRTLSTGVIDPLDAASVNTAGQGALESKLMQPKNARGVRGHVSAVGFQVDLANNLNLTGNLQTKIGIRPLGYAYTISQQLGFTLNV